ncbi:MAG: ATP-binding protein [Tannerellaceae bacterium]|nr:ATP-binding protein [Tannerellaceae bacterium]
MALSIKEKDAVKDALRAYCAKYPSQNKAAASINVSSGTISSILNGKYENISDDMFKNIRQQINAGSADWQMGSTPTFKDIYFALENAQTTSSVTWVLSPAGTGKTATAEQYRRDNSEVYYVLCDDDMRKGDFVRDFAKAVGIKIEGYKRVREILFMIIEELNKKEQPLIIFDEGDKLKDDVLYYFITIYNHLKDQTGIVFLSTSFMDRRMQIGLEYDKKGFDELHSRIGRKFYQADTITANDIITICMANGITDDQTIAEVISDATIAPRDKRSLQKRGSEQSPVYDLRRVTKKIKAIKGKRSSGK